MWKRQSVPTMPFPFDSPHTAWCAGTWHQPVRRDVTRYARVGAGLVSFSLTGATPRGYVTCTPDSFQSRTYLAFERMAREAVETEGLEAVGGKPIRKPRHLIQGTGYRRFPAL